MARREFKPVYGFHYRGDTLPVSVQFPVEGAAPPNIAGRILFATLKTSLDDPDESALFSVAHTVPSGPEAEAGSAYFEVPHTAADVAPGRYWLDVQCVIPGSPPRVFTLHIEQIEIRADGTRRITP